MLLRTYLDAAPHMEPEQLSVSRVDTPADVAAHADGMAQLIQEQYSEAWPSIPTVPVTRLKELVVLRSVKTDQQGGQFHLATAGRQLRIPHQTRPVSWLVRNTFGHPLGVGSFKPSINGDNSGVVGVYVRREWRRRGIGSILWRTVTDAAKQAHCRTVTVKTTNLTASIARDRLLEGRDPLQYGTMQIATSSLAETRQRDIRAPGRFGLVKIDLQHATDTELDSLWRLKRMVAAEYRSVLAARAIPSSWLIRQQAALSHSVGVQLHVFLLYQGSVICGYVEYSVDACVPTLLKREGRALIHEVRGTGAARYLIDAEVLMARSDSALASLMTCSRADTGPFEDCALDNRLLQTSWRVLV